MKAIVLLFALLSITFAADDFLTLVTETPVCNICCSTLANRTTMNYTYYIDTAHFIGGDGDWSIDTYGYSGNSSGLNNPNDTCVIDEGPAPATEYQIAFCTDLMHGDVTRPCSYSLNPLDESQMCGRSGIFIHGCQCCTLGDYTVPPIGGCSIGCIIIHHEDRIKLRVGDYISVVKYEPSETRRDAINF